MAEIYQKLKEEAEKLAKIPGNSRGEILRTHFNYIKIKKGEEGLKQVLCMMERLDYPIKLKEINSLSWYPEYLGVLVILVAKELFKWNDSDIYNWGYETPKFSFIVRMVMKHFLTLKITYQKAPVYWQEHYDFGELEVPDFSEKEKYFIIRVKGYKFHPIVCEFHKGYYVKIAEFGSRNKKFFIEETKCMFRGDPYHEFKTNWIDII